MPMVDYIWSAGDFLRVARHRSSPPGTGLTYDEQFVQAIESGRSGGHDVFTGRDVNNREISFYGFSVDKVMRATPDPLTIAYVALGTKGASWEITLQDTTSVQRNRLTIVRFKQLPTITEDTP